MAVVILNTANPPVGTITQFAATIGTVTNIAGAQKTTPGRYQHNIANSVAGGVPLAGSQRLTLFPPLATLLSGYAPVKYSPVAGAVNGVIEPWLMGSFRRGLMGSWLISTPGSTPAVQFPAGMVVSVSC